jgi:tRNA A-37 threonylcarbamoyl transferase component Bud32
MRPLVTDQELDARLKFLQLERDDSPGAPPPSKNRTLVARHGRRRMMVKLADGPGNVGVLREGSVLERVARLAAVKGSPLVVPQVFAFDPGYGLLALEWLPQAETLHHFHRRTGDYPKLLARQVGRGLGFLHRASREDPSRFALAETFRDEADLLECFLRMRPDFYARLSREGLDFFASVQADGPAMVGLQALSEAQHRESEACLLHGDMRQANLVRVGRARVAPLVFIDWELSLWGDPARDLGSLLCDYVLGWLAPEHRSEVMSRAQLSGFGRALLLGYAEERGKEFSLEATFQERVVRWVGAALLIYVYGISHYEQVLDARAQAVARHALDMLGAPERWPRTLWGAG